MTGCKAACPHCGVDVWWVSGKELKDHSLACSTINLGLLSEQLTPAVERKPEGWSYPYRG